MEDRCDLFPRIGMGLGMAYIALIGLQVAIAQLSLAKN